MTQWECMHFSDGHICLWVLNLVGNRLNSRTTWSKGGPDAHRNEPCATVTHSDFWCNVKARFISRNTHWIEWFVYRLYSTCRCDSNVLVSGLLPVPVRWRGGVIGDSEQKRVREKRETAAALHLFCIIPEEEEEGREEYLENLPFTRTLQMSRVGLCPWAL